MPSLESVSRSSAYERRLALTVLADDRQDAVIASINARGFSFDWPTIIDAAKDAADLEAAIARATHDALRSREFRDTISALAVNGKAIAILVQRRAERDAGLRAGARYVAFAEAPPTVFEPSKAVEYWQRILGLSDAEVEALIAGINSFQNEAFVMSGRIAAAVMERVAAIIARTIGEGLPLIEFVREAAEVLPNASRATLETEYRTHLTNVYGTSRHEEILARQVAFPFIQFMATKDTRTTWWMCLPMGSAGPGGRGYIAAADDGIWFTWRPPNHYRCRSDLSPISYLEAQRLGILAADGRTRIAIVGDNPNRPFGDPPKFATDPVTGNIRRVEPQLGFGA
jgi:hypothetical protein